MLHRATSALSWASTCKSGQTQSEGHIHPLEKSHDSGSCCSLGTGLFHGLILANSQRLSCSRERAAVKQRQEEVPGAQQACTPHQHGYTTVSSQANVQVGTRVCKSKVMIFSDPWHDLFLARDGPPLRNTDAKSHSSCSMCSSLLGKMLGPSFRFNLFSTQSLYPSLIKLTGTLGYRVLSLTWQQCNTYHTSYLLPDSNLYVVRQTTQGNLI